MPAWQKGCGCLFTIVLVASIGLGIFSWCSGGTDDSDSSPVPTPKPTITTEDAEKMIIVCERVAAAGLKMQESGRSDEEIIIAIASELDFTVNQVTDLLGICATYFKNAP